MGLIKITVQEEKTRYTKDPVDDETTYWETVHEMTSTERSVIAGTLRAIANKYDPPKPLTRGTDEY